MIERVWVAIKGKRATLPSPPHFKVRLPDEDEPTSDVDTSQAPSHEGEAISGFTCILDYCDARGRDSERRITCQRLDRAADGLYVVAYCHERLARRIFKVARMVALVDLQTGEVVDDPSTFFAGFAVDRSQRSGLSWGLSVRKRADLIAGLNALAFVARCDTEWHPLEAEAIESFVASFWLRLEIEGEPPCDEILRHAQRLSPDAETFYVSLARCDRNPQLAALIHRHIRSVIDADGVVRPEEVYWGTAVDDYFRSLLH